MVTKVLGPRTEGPFEVRLAYTGATRVVPASQLLAEGVDLAAHCIPLGATVKLTRAGEHTGRTGTVVSALPEKGRQCVRLHADKPVFCRCYPAP